MLCQVDCLQCGGGSDDNYDNTGVCNVTLECCADALRIFGLHPLPINTKLPTLRISYHPMDEWQAATEQTLVRRHQVAPVEDNEPECWHAVALGYDKNLEILAQMYVLQFTPYTLPRHVVFLCV